MIARDDIGTATAEPAASRASSTVMIVVALVVVIAFTALWISELMSPPGTLRLPSHAPGAGLNHQDEGSAVG